MRVSWVSALLLLLTIAGALYYVLSTVAVASLFRGKPEFGVPVYRPRVSVLKPASGVDREAAANFASYLRQDYPDYEVIFGVLDPSAPVIETILETMQGYKQASQRIGTSIRGANNKVRILHHLAKRASGEIFVITDADTRVEAHFLDAIIAPMADASVGVVTCLYRGVEAGSAADALEGLHMSCVFAPGVACARSLGGIDFGLGAAIAIRSSVLRSIGGFESLVNYLADDFQLGRRPAILGHEVRLCRYVIDEVLTGEGLGSVLARELRWSRTTRVSRPGGHLGLVFTFGFTYAVAYAAVTATAAGLGILGSVMGVRMLTAWVGARKMGDYEFARRAWLLPVRDVLSFGIWVAGYFGSTVTWRGRKLRVKRDGRIESWN